MERSSDNSDHSSRAAVIRDGLGRQVIGQSGKDGKRVGIGGKLRILGLTIHCFMAAQYSDS